MERCRLSLPLMFQPCLEHVHITQPALPMENSGEMLAQVSSDQTSAQESLILKSLSRLSLRPIPASARGLRMQHDFVRALTHGSAQMLTTISSISDPLPTRDNTSKDPVSLKRNTLP